VMPGVGNVSPVEGIASYKAIPATLADLSQFDF